MGDRSGRPALDRAGPADHRRSAGADAARLPAVDPAARAQRGVVWSNANVNENFPGPDQPAALLDCQRRLLPLLPQPGPLVRHVAPRGSTAMEQPLRHIIGVHGARMYYNLTSIHAVLRSAPFGDLLAASFNQFVGSEPTDTAAAVPFARRAPRTAASHGARAGPHRRPDQRQYCVTRAARRAIRAARRCASPPRTHPDRCSSIARCGTRSTIFEAFLHIRCHQWNDAALADAGSMVCYGVLQRLLARAFPGGRSAGAPQLAAQGAARARQRPAGDRALEAGRSWSAPIPELHAAFRRVGRGRMSCGAVDQRPTFAGFQARPCALPGGRGASAAPAS